MFIPCDSEQLEQLLNLLDEQRLAFVHITQIDGNIMIETRESIKPIVLSEGIYFHYQAYQCLKAFKQAFENGLVKDIEFSYTMNEGPHSFRATYYPLPQDDSMATIEDDKQIILFHLQQCLEHLASHEIPISQLLYRPKERKKSQSTHLKQIIEVLIKELKDDETIK